LVYNRNARKELQVNLVRNTGLSNRVKEREMSEYRVVLATASNVAEAEKIADCLLNNKQAACINIFEKVRSRYWWEGKIEKTEEALMIIKTKRENIGKIIEIIKKEHSYAVPEIIALPIMEGNEDYLKWISKETK